jgi:preprotein translocase subunit YajC
MRVKVCASGLASGADLDLGPDFDLDVAIVALSVCRSLSGPAHTPQAAKAGKTGISGPFSRIARRCNWSADRYIPRTFQAPLGWQAPPGQPPAYRRTQRPFMFISPAYAQAPSFLGGGDNMLVSLLPFILIFVIMYFLILRPQQKRQKQHADMVKNVRRGDTVVTSGGLVGKVTKVIDDEQVEVEVAEDVRVRQMRSMLADVRAKGEPVKEEGASS